MKKVVKISFAVIFIILALTSVIRFSNENIRNLRAIPPQFRFAMEIDAYETEILDALLAAAEEKGVDIMRQVSYYDNDEKKSIVTDYVYTTTKYNKRCDLISGRMICASDMDYLSCFVSTEKTNNKEQIGHVYGFSSSTVYYIRPLKAIIQKYEIKGTYNISTLTQEDAEGFATIVSEYLYDEYNIVLDAEKYEVVMNASSAVNSDENIDAILQYVRIAAFCALLLLFTFSCVFFGKEISVLKINGYSSWQSVVHVILRSLLYITLISLVFVSGCLVIADGFRVNLLLSILPGLILYCSIELFLSILVYLGYTATVKTTQTIKGRAPIRVVSIFNLVFYILVSVLCIGVTSTTLSNTNRIRLKTENLSVWASVQDYGVFFPVSSGLDQDAIRRGEYPLDIPAYEFFKYVNKNEDAIYAASLPFMEENALYNTDILNRIFVVNANYLLLFPVIDNEGAAVEIEQSEQRTIYLVPEKYKSLEREIKMVLCEDRRSFHDGLHVGLYAYDELPLAREVKIIYVANDQEYFSINPDVEPENYNMISDAIIQVITDGNCLVPDINLFGSRPFLYIPLKGLAPAEKKAALMNALKSNSLDDNLPNFVLPNTLILQEIDDLRSQTQALLVVMAAFTALIVVAVCQAIASLFRLNEYKCFILLSLGKPKMMALCGIIIPVVIAQALISIVGIVLFGEEALNSLLVVQAIELCFVFVIILIGEKKNLMNVLKKGV